MEQNHGWVRGTLSFAGEQPGSLGCPTSSQRACWCCLLPLPAAPSLRCSLPFFLCFPVPGAEGTLRRDTGEASPSSRHGFSPGRIVLSEQERNVWLPHQVHSNSFTAFLDAKGGSLSCRGKRRGSGSVARTRVSGAGRGTAAPSAAGVRSCPSRLPRPQNPPQMGKKRVIVGKSLFGLFWGFFWTCPVPFTHAPGAVPSLGDHQQLVPISRMKTGTAQLPRRAGLSEAVARSRPISRRWGRGESSRWHSSIG